MNLIPTMDASKRDAARAFIIQMPSWVALGANQELPLVGIVSQRRARNTLFISWTVAVAEARRTRFPYLSYEIHIWLGT